MSELVALIPARAGSKRVPGKNIKPLAGHPLIAYAVASAIQSGVFNEVYCVTESSEYAEIARYYGATVIALRPLETATDVAPDFLWVRWKLNLLQELGMEPENFAILRPTSPFRSACTIQSAVCSFFASPEYDSLRAVRLCREHPGKMWYLEDQSLHPLMDAQLNGVPLHSNQYAQLPRIFVQDASLEICRTSVVSKYRNTSGDRILAFHCPGYEGFDINSEDDWLMSELLISKEMISLPLISQPPYSQRF